MPYAKALQQPFSSTDAAESGLQKQTSTVLGTPCGELASGASQANEFYFRDLKCSLRLRF
jgi:hypothetical protein